MPRVSSVQSKQYILDSLVSVNELCQSWLGRERSTGRDCFLKVPNPDSRLDFGVQDGILYRSWLNQRALSSRAVVRARAAERERGRLLVEYPVLAPGQWGVLTPEVLWRDFDWIFPAICVTIDYVHLMGLVHCDLKLDNFVVRREGEGFEVRLIDLEFLTRVNERPQHMVFGSPDHIAPEIRNDEGVYQQSDQYSLGISLMRSLEGTGGEEAVLGGDRVSALRKLLQSMTREDPMLRPRVLINALHEHDLVGEAEFRRLEKRLFGMLVVSHFRGADRTELADEKEVRQLLEEQAHVLNIPGEVYENAAAASRSARRATYEAVRDFLVETEVERTGDYWLTRPADELILQLQERLDVIRGERWADFDSADGSPSGMERALAGFERERAAGRPITAYLRLRKYAEAIAERGDELDAGAYYAFREKLMRAAEGLGRWGEALRVQEELLGCEAPDDEAWFGRRYHRAWLLTTHGLYAEGQSALEELLREPIVMAVPARYLKALRLLVFLEYRVGESSHVDELADLLEGSKELPCWDCGIAYYILANVRGLTGDLDQAAIALRRSTGLCRAEGIWAQVAVNLDFQSLMFVNEGKYREAEHYAQLSLRLIRRSRGGSPRSQFCNLLGASSRLGQKVDAEYWSSQLHAQAIREGTVVGLAQYYANEGLVRGSCGDMRGAREALVKVLEFSGQRVSAEVLDQVFHRLAEVAFFQGNRQLVEEYTTRLINSTPTGRNYGFLCETDLMRELAAFYYGSDRSLVRLRQLLTILLTRRYRYYGFICAFHLLLHGNSEMRLQVLEVIQPHAEVYRASEAPVFRSVAMLSEMHARESEYAVEVRVLKEVFRILKGAGQKFLAMQVAGRIAALYAGNGLAKLARKFYQQARKLAAGLENGFFVRHYDEAIASLSDSVGDQGRLVNAMHGISQILKNMQDYEASLQRLVEFAVNETGAERGALLLKVGQTSDLYVAAYFNCDEGSLPDIQDISSSVPLDATRALEPLIIENALTDARTQNYKSVIYHNIHSVLCVPILFEEEVLGTLYLDHHTISALFEKDDVTYIFAIANFLALMLSALKQYKSVNIVNRELMEELRRAGGHMAFITRDESVLAMLRGLPEIARSDAPVLLIGESGTGKEILARRIHALSLRAEMPFVPLNCAALPETLVESELFGIKKGVATGVGEREGKFAAADGGTLFLDEIAEMQLAVQAKVLRVLEYGQYERVGSNRTLWSDVRFIYATNKDLGEMVKRGTFREDLYYRINVCVIEIPPLRERPRDIPVLIDYFLEQFCRRTKPPRFTSDVMNALSAYAWPGNVRELRNFVERICIVRPGREVGLDVLTEEMRGTVRPSVYSKEEAEAVERERIREALLRNGGNQSAAARELSMSVSTLRRRIKKYGLQS